MKQKTLSQQKSVLRTQLKQIRAAVPEDSRREYAEKITQRLLGLDEVITAKSIFIYISHADEVNTHPLINSLLERDRFLAVPKIINSNYMVAVPFTSWDDLIKGQFGILTPVSSETNTNQFDIAITPGLGFTLSGHRMGFGRAYYDKWFAKHQTTYKIGLSFEAQIVDELPIEETDIPVDIIVTEKRIIRQ